MQKALQYGNGLPAATSAGGSAVPPPGEPESGGKAAVNVRKLVEENAVVVFAREGCCMCHVLKLLLNGHGVNPVILEVDDQNEGHVTDELSRIIGVGDAGTEVPQLPAVFVGGELFGGLEQVMDAHISGELVPRLRKARALWL